MLRVQGLWIYVCLGLGSGVLGSGSSLRAGFALRASIKFGVLRFRVRA